MRLAISRELGKQYVVWPQRLRRWKDKYEGQACWLIGNGPSLAETPLDLLDGQMCFGLNSIAKIYDKTDWRPTFYVNVTGMVMSPGWAEHARTSVSLGIPSFLAVQYIPFLYRPDALPENAELVMITQGHEQTRAKPPQGWWSDDIGERISNYGTSMFAVMQIAGFMGFKQFRLLGCDLGWKPFDHTENKDPNHFDEGYWESAVDPAGNPRPVDEDRATRFNEQALSAHKLAKKVATKRGIDIVNATIGGELEVYPRVNMVDYL